MRGALWISLFLLGLAGVVIPVVYLFVASQLPDLESERDLEMLLRSQIEAERKRVRLGQAASDIRVSYERPDFSKLPKDQVALYISQRGCATFFQTPREEGLRWGWRMMAGMVDHEFPGDGWCEQLLAGRLAARIGVEGTLKRAVATHKIHALLQKDQLVAYDLTSHGFEDGVVGLDAVTWKLFQKVPEKLSLAEKAELELALPPHNYYEQMRDCQNPSLIRQNRDHLLRQLQLDGLVPEEWVKSAMAQPVACTR